MVLNGLQTIRGAVGKDPGIRELRQALNKAGLAQQTSFETGSHVAGPQLGAGSAVMCANQLLHAIDSDTIANDSDTQSFEVILVSMVCMLIVRSSVLHVRTEAPPEILSI
jgi:hypothetical protein